MSTHKAELVGGPRDGTPIEVDDYIVRRGILVVPEVHAPGLKDYTPGAPLDPGAGFLASEVRYRLDGIGRGGALRFVREAP